jgi:hypothetical protein
MPNKSLKRRALEYGFARYYRWRLAEFYENQLIEVDYPVNPVPRYPAGQSSHPLLWHWFDRGREQCAEALQAMAGFRSTFEGIPNETADESSPHWQQKWFSALDGMALYMFVARRRPARIVEVGSGNSTKFAARAIGDHGLATTITSIDPQPRAEIDKLCARVIRQPLEQVDQQVFFELARGDFLIIDNSHRAFTNSDVTTFFLEILPNLQPGVVLHLHDIFLPWDYPEQWRNRYYSEQYLLGCWILAGPERLRLLLSNVFVSYDNQLRRLVMDLFAGSTVAHMVSPEFSYGSLRGVSGTSFWSEVVI